MDESNSNKMILFVTELGLYNEEKAAIELLSFYTKNDIKITI